MHARVKSKAVVTDVVAPVHFSHVNLNSHMAFQKHVKHIQLQQCVCIKYKDVERMLFCVTCTLLV